MKWEQKARIQKICSIIPLGDKLYVLIQKNFGTLKVNPMRRIPTQIEMVRWLLDQGFELGNKTFFEVGTGHIPVAPIGFFLSGAGSVITVDIHRRLDWNLTQKTLSWIVENRQEIELLYQPVVDVSVFRQRMELIQEYQLDPRTFFEKANITYHSPTDAARTGLQDGSVDVHFSITTFEHIPQNILHDIMSEARRLLSPSGVAIHFIDPSDHFQHQDRTITAINFLRFSEQEWERIGGNQFSYCNRLRASDFFSLFRSLSFEVLRTESKVDNESLEAIRQGFPLDKLFEGYEQEDICTTSLRVLLKP
jgi:hypothetical protein